MNRNQPNYTTNPAPTRKDTCARTWQIDRETSAAINALADELECFPSDLVNMLLSRAIDAVESEQWPIERRPYKYTLHWGQGASNGNQAGTKSDRTGA